MENNNLHSTVESFPQGDLASPCLANLALDGLEKAILASSLEPSDFSHSIHG